MDTKPAAQPSHTGLRRIPSPSWTEIRNRFELLRVLKLEVYTWRFIGSDEKYTSHQSKAYPWESPVDTPTKCPFKILEFATFLRHLFVVAYAMLSVPFPARMASRLQLFSRRAAPLIHSSRSPRLRWIILASCLILILRFSYPLAPLKIAQQNLVKRSNLCPNVPPMYNASAFDTTEWRRISQKHPVSKFKQLPTNFSKSIPRIQFSFKPRGSAEADYLNRRRAVVKATFQRCWKSYTEKAWKQDQLSPISGNSANPYGGLGASLIDNLDTLWIMGMYDEFNEAVEAAMEIDVGPHHLHQPNLNVFEITIRHLGGLLAAYDVTGCQDQRLLTKAVEFGDLLYAAWDTPDRSPKPDFSPEKAAKGQEQAFSRQSLVLIGSEALEFTRLSQLTGDMRYYDAVQRMTDILQQQQGRTKLGGLWPIHVTRDENNELDFTSGSTFSLGAEGDSTYEYLLKMAILLGGTEEADQYAGMWRWAMDTAVKRMLFRPMIPSNGDILLPGEIKILDDGAIALYAVTQHLECFLGGMFAMGSKVLPAKYFGQETHMMIGRKLTIGCVWAYRSTPSGIMPESFTTLACPSIHQCSWNETLWEEKAPGDLPTGFMGSSGRSYHLRPEAIESVFYLYRITGDNRWQDVAWKMFKSVEKATRTDLGNAAIADVFQKESTKLDTMESFWMAETLKYFYLIFSEPDVISLDDYVFNTEAHPFRRPRPVREVK